MDFQKNQLVLESGRCQTEERKKKWKLMNPKNGGSFVDSLLKLEEMESCPLLSVGLYMAIKDTDITRVSSP
jgi:hypothetical protein